MNEGNVQRLRFVYTKGREVKYISHLDLARAMERACRRAKLSMVYSQGFNPHPRTAYASALPVGVTGRAEVGEIWLSPPMEPAAFLERMNLQLPRGMSVSDATEADARAPALQALTRWADYEVHLYETPDDLDARIAALLAQEELPRKRARKDELISYDLRPLIAEIRRLPGSEDAVGMRLANASGATGRVDEVLRALDLRPELCDIERTRLLFDGDLS